MQNKCKMLATSDQHDVTLERKGLNRVLRYAHFIRCDSLESSAFVRIFFPRPLRTYFTLFNNGDDVERKFRTLEIYLLYFLF